MSFDKQAMSEILQAMCDAAIVAGSEVLNIYNDYIGNHKDLAIQAKKDNSPVTTADLAAHASLIKSLGGIDDPLPLLSEEAEIPDFQERQQWRRYWLIDPLDGTKEFIEGNGEFTVNIALIEAGKPIAGVVYVPVTGQIFMGATAHGAYSFNAKEEKKVQGEKLKTRDFVSRLNKKLSVDVVCSRRHGSEAFDSIYKKITNACDITAKKAIGSSLKICMIAAGEADIYPRCGPTSEWDTAAAQAILEAAGGYIVDHDFQPLRYNQKESLLNPEFYALGADLDAWKKILV
jgi:3'(2'), 5'-bisphosphate nucleotidase